MPNKASILALWIQCRFNLLPKVTFPLLINILEKVNHFYIDVKTGYHNIKSAFHYITQTAGTMLFIRMGKRRSREKKKSRFSSQERTGLERCIGGLHYGKTQVTGEGVEPGTEDRMALHRLQALWDKGSFPDTKMPIFNCNN